jgi:hypothetical protein
VTASSIIVGKVSVAQTFARLTAAFVLVAKGPALAQEMKAEQAQLVASLNR